MQIEVPHSCRGRKHPLASVTEGGARPSHGSGGDCVEATEQEERVLSIALIVTRPGAAIALSEWTRLVDEDDDLRLRVQRYEALNPGTGQNLSIRAGEADAEIQIAGQWLPFLRFRDGGLTTRYILEFDDPQNAMRVKITTVARRLGALIMTDAGDESLNW